MQETAIEMLVVRPDVAFTALTSSGMLQTYRALKVSASTNEIAISGLQTEETILAIDYSPANFQDGPLNPSTPSILGAAYLNNFAGATVTALFDIDFTTDKLYLQHPPNSGTLVEIKFLGINAEASSGFDIVGTSGIAYALLTVGTATKIYTIDLATGAATAGVDFTKPVRGLAIGLGF